MLLSVDLLVFYIFLITKSKLNIRNHLTFYKVTVKRITKSVYCIIIQGNSFFYIAVEPNQSMVKAGFPGIPRVWQTDGRRRGTGA